MNKQIDNPFLRQIVTNISEKANAGRMVDINWGVLTESRKKKTKLVSKGIEEANIIKQKSEKPKVDDTPADEKPADDVVPQGAEPEGDQAPKVDPLKGGSAPDLPPMDSKGEEAPVSDKEEAPASEDNPEDADQAQADAAKANAELEKAKAEKDQAEKELKKQSYIHLVSNAGVHFLLAKLVDHAFKTNTIDSLASEMTGKLKIQTPEEYANFAEEMAPYKGIPGVAELLASMKGMASKQPDTGEEGAESRADNEPSAA